MKLNKNNAIKLEEARLANERAKKQERELLERVAKHNLEVYGITRELRRHIEFNRQDTRNFIDYELLNYTEEVETIEIKRTDRHGFSHYHQIIKKVLVRKYNLDKRHPDFYEIMNNLCHTQGQANRKQYISTVKNNNSLPTNYTKRRINVEKLLEEEMKTEGKLVFILTSEGLVPKLF